ncbi:hypothetical protein BVRB_3g066170 [Beta vulgaris subsp. vulgaris]|nr:hypothetical protein BVRB_3g066170 [Beta vulgaris subsp. vulgaris]
MMREMKSLKGQMEYLDRISELPDFILHLILSFLKTEEACRTSILSKQWYNAWASMPNLDFEPQYFENLYAANWYDEELVQIYVGYIDKTMRRYAEEKYFIRTFRLEFPSVDKNLAPFIDKWVGIAVQNKVEEIDLNISEELADADAAEIKAKMAEEMSSDSDSDDGEEDAGSTEPPPPEQPAAGPSA